MHALAGRVVHRDDRRVAAEEPQQLAGRDARFIYVQQAMWRGGEPTSSVLIRSAVAGPGGIVPTDEVAAAVGWEDWNPPLAPWVAAWAEADALRPWPPVP